MTNPPTGHDHTGQEERRQEIRDYFNAAGMAEPWAYEQCVEDYTTAILQLIETEASRRERELLDKVKSIIIKRGQPDNYYGEVWEWVKDGLKSQGGQG